MRLMNLRALPALLLLDCSSPPPPAAPPPPEPCVAPRLKVSLAASERVNAGPDAKGLPVRVRVYQLKSETRLMNAFFEEVWKSDAATLAEDLVNFQEVTVFPGQRQELTLDQLPDSRVLSAVALFREPQGRDWFLNYDLQQPDRQGSCPPPEPRISIWLDRMKIQDGEGRVEASTGTPMPDGSSEDGAETLPGKGD